MRARACCDRGSFLDGATEANAVLNALLKPEKLDLREFAHESSPTRELRAEPEARWDEARLPPLAVGADAMIAGDIVSAGWLSTAVENARSVRRESEGFLG